MRIERIELTGFKSFSEKTVFNFHPGITAIVGPNGCGKSNIVDAFRWVLGEQSAKSLRGDRMEDVIFLGSTSRRPKGMAEVTLVISGVNNNGNLSETGEISVTRRLFRSGESEYLMNKIPCRLKDIKNVFLDTGLELKTYSILEQGRIEEILNSKPYERRFLIEEAAGVMKYNVRKAEALQKLESSRLNLQRLQDIIAEVKRQINSISRYAKRAEKYRELFEEIKNIEIKIALEDIASLSRELNDIMGLEITLKSKEAELSTNIHSYDGLIEEKRLLFLKTEKNLEEIQKKLHITERDLLEEEGRISLLKSDCENLKDRLQRLLMRDSELAGVEENIITQIKNIENKDAEMEIELLNIEETLNSKNEVFLTLENEIADLERNLETRRKYIFSKAEEISTLKNEINNLSLMMENLDRKVRKSIDDIKTVSDEISLHIVSMKEVKDKYHGLDAELKNKYKTRERLLKDTNGKKEALIAKEDGLYREREDLAAMTSRVESLKELDADRKGMANNIKILCQVADILDPLPEYETAIEAALGDKLNVAVVDDHHEITKALGFIKQQGIDRRGFISIHLGKRDVSNGVHIPHSFPVSDFSGSVIGKAIDFVKVREGFNNIATLLLNDVIIVSDLNTAFDLWSREARYFVTLDGEVLEPSGIVFGGIEKSILRIRREIRTLEREIEDKKTHIFSTEEEIASLKNNITSTEGNIVSLDKEISQTEKTCHELELKITSLQEEEIRKKKRLEYLSIELQQDKKERDETAHVLDEKNKTCSVLEEERRSVEEEIRGFQDEITDKKSLLETVRSELTETMLSRTAIKEKRDSLIKESERLNSELLDMKKKKEEISKERLEIEDNLKHKKDEIKKKEESLKSLVVMIDELQKESSNVKEILEAKTAELSIMEKQQKTYIDELSSVRRDIAQIEIKKAELSLRLTHIKEDIKKTYSIELDSITGLEPLLAEEKERLPVLRERLQEIGPVNLGTLEELEELKARHDFLTKQEEDILQSIATLQETISRISSTTSRKLRDAFEALNEKFKEVFTILFGKGRAELILTEENILEAGIDIVAQPPGKKLQNLMLLSGGETALTVLSLLFAGFMIRPTPLCILDEVDAPLDESNIERFTSLLKDLSKNIQFITITHNRRAMEVADYLYGITMEEPGISKVMSMHMAEAV